MHRLEPSMSRIKYKENIYEFGLALFSNRYKMFKIGI